MKYLILFIVTIAILGCSDDCENENPTVVLVNNAITKADIQVKTSGGNTENINNIQSGETSERRSFDPGIIQFTISIQGLNDPLEYEFTTNYCTAYTITINENNTISHSGKNLEKIIIY